MAINYEEIKKQVVKDLIENIPEEYDHKKEYIRNILEFVTQKFQRNNILIPVLIHVIIKSDIDSRPIEDVYKIILDEITPTMNSWNTFSWKFVNEYLNQLNRTNDSDIEADVMDYLATKIVNKYNNGELSNDNCSR